MTLIDTHCHINFESYDADRAEVLNRAAAVGVTRVLNPAVDLATSHAGIALAREYTGVMYAAVGVHPNSTSDFALSMITELRELSHSSGVVSIGEIGLDYYRDRSPKATQIPAFEAQLELAAELELPVIIHNREASDDVMAILENWVKTLPASLINRPGVLHSFSAPPTIAERALAAGFYLGFTGPITYKNADELRTIAAKVPLDRMLVETDGPFLTPVPYRGKRNEPAYIPLIVDRLAALKRLTSVELGAATNANAERLFQFKSR
ncbi:MAG: TatD family hydrolase [Anaerolineae bacterium]|nr:TatD family hydrolase [Anaerolineae bacterium]